MKATQTYASVIAVSVVLAFSILSAPGCGSLEENVALGTVGATVVGAQAPAHEVEQTYYLGVFDPQDQLPPSIYRVRVHGQASFISGTKFASGWVPAKFIDSLGTNIQFDSETNTIKFEDAGNTDKISELETGRRLMLFGPEGFRESPKGHRLVIVMGASPENFFQAIDESLGIIAQAIQSVGDAALDRLLFETLVRTQAEREELDELIFDTAKDLGQE